LVFEGIIRKFAPGALSTVVFFIKDLLCLIGVYYIINFRLTVGGEWLKNIISTIFLLLLPLLCYHAFFDPILFVWGGKLYLLYTVMAVLMTIAFPVEAITDFKKWMNFVQILILPTVLVGLLQLQLPISHWLNRAVDGQSLQRFSAGGILRISSTFSFTGQYSFFLVFVTVIYLCNYFFNVDAKNKNNYLLNIVLGLLLIIGCFSTGGRTAVLGFFSVLIIGICLIAIKNSVFLVKKMFIPAVASILLLPFIYSLKPEYFAVFEKRTKGKGGSSEAILDRVLQPFSDLADATFFGKGLGVMTNGAQKISSYAESIRLYLWTETDFSTIVWEGGFYLVIVWYGFRIFLIVFCLKLLSRIKNKNYYSAASFLVAYIIIQGLMGTLSLQPPLAIYFWISIGALICIQQFDKKISV